MASVSLLKIFVGFFGFLTLAPLAGGLIAGVDRILSARMQRRVGPPLLQPFYDVFKLFSKETRTENQIQYPFIVIHLVLTALSGALFFAGVDLLFVLFVLAAASVFFILSAFSVHSPYSFIGAERELILVAASEPMLLITVAGFYLVCQSFQLSGILALPLPLIIFLPGVFFGFFYLLTLKLRKSPFDISTSHHAHQELVKGLTTDMSGRTLALIEIAHWYETVFLMVITYLFFTFNSVWGPIVGILATLICYFCEIVIDNTHARVKWTFAFKSAWWVTLLTGGVNLLVLQYLFNR